MSNGLVWRRCPACGQLTLVPATANVCWQCGAPHAGHRPQSDAFGGEDFTPASDLPAGGPIPGVGPGLSFGLPRGQEPWWSVHRLGVERTPSVRRSSAPTLTAAEEAIAHRLLSSVFPDGIEP